MQYSIPVLLLWLFLHSAVGQNQGGDSSSVDRRCVRLRRQTQPPVRLLPMSCNNVSFYDNDDAVFNGSRINLLPRVLDMIKRRIESSSNPECAESVQQYLCHYYFPRCNLTTGEIIPVCDSSCELLFNNDSCRGLFTIASQELGRSNIPIPNDTCLRTYRSFNIRPPSVSDECTEIRVPLSANITNGNTSSETVNNNETDTTTNSNDTATTTNDDDTATNNNTTIDTTHDNITNSGTTNISTMEPNITNQDENSADRCFEFRGQNQHRPVPMACNSLRFYDISDGVFNESRINNLQRVLDRVILNTINARSVDDPECTESVQQYLCHYYFPRCNLTTGEIIPVCNSNCELLFNNDNCRDLFMLASQELRRINLPHPDESCLRTHRLFNNPPSVSDTCTEIEVPLHDDVDADSGATNSDDDSNTNTVVIGVIVAIVAAVVIVIITILIVVLVVRRGRKKRITSERYINTEEQKEERYIVTQFSQHSDEGKTALKDNSSEIYEMLKYVEENFSDVLFPKGIVTKLELIGKGAFGVVHKGELKNSDNTITAVAIKSIKSGSLDAMKDLVAESSIMKTFHHPNVLPLLGVCIDYDDEDMLKVVMPFMANGDLKTFLKNKRVAPSNTHEYSKDLSENMLLKMCLDIAKGMEYVAHKRVVHRDLAARNCMVDGKLTIRVADFGLTRDIYTTEYYRADKHATLPVKWMSLESLLDGYFDEKTDVWSYGVTCWEIFSLGRIPYPGVDNVDVINFLKHGKRLDKPELCPSMMFEMIEMMWQEESSKRQTFAEIVETLQTNIRKASVTSETDKYNYVDILAQ